MLVGPQGWRSRARLSHACFTRRGRTTSGRGGEIASRPATSSERKIGQAARRGGLRRPPHHPVPSATVQIHVVRDNVRSIVLLPFLIVARRLEPALHADPRALA